MVAGLEPVRRSVGDEQRTDREPVRERLRERDRVRPDAELLPGEEAARAADAALDLVEDQQRAVLVGERAGGGQELRARRVDPALALDRLDQDRPGVRSDGGRERLGVVQPREPNRGRQRLERLRACPAGRSPRARRASARGTSPRARRRPASRSPCAPTSAPPRSPPHRSCRRTSARRRSGPRAAPRGGASARSSRGWRYARARRAGRAQPPAAPDGSGRARRPRSRRAGRGSACRRRRSARRRRPPRR